MFAERLGDALKMARLTQSDLATFAGLSKATINNYVSGKTKPKHHMIAKFAEILNVDARWLSGEGNDPKLDRPEILRPKDAAIVLNSNPASVRIRMQKNLFQPSIGTACKLTGTRYSYEIYPEKLAEFLNITVEAVYERLKGTNE